MSYKNMPIPLFKFCLTPLFFSFLLSSCANLSQIEKESLAEVKALQDQFSDSQDNALYHLKLAQEYERLGKAESSISYYKKAIDEYNKALALEPANTNSLFSLYKLTYMGVIQGFAKMSNLSLLYSRIDEQIRKSLNPPHLALFQRESALASYTRISRAALEDILYKAFLENPQNPRVSFMMSNYWIDNERYIMGIDILKRSLYAYPDEQYLNLQLGIAYEAYANRNFCPFQNKSALKKSLNHLQKAAKEMPNSAYLNNTLVSLYERLNVSILMVDAAKKLQGENPGVYEKLTLAEAYSNVGQLEKSESIFQALIEQGDHSALISKAMVYAENGKWEESYASSKRYMELGNELDLYSALLHLSLEKILSKEETSYNDMKRYVDESSFSEWEKALYSYWYDQVSEDELTELNNNLCRAVELDYLTGVKLLKSNERARANSYFKGILDSKAYSFVEYKVARHLIQ